MSFYRIVRTFSSSSFLAMMGIFLLANSVAQAQCMFFTSFADNKDGTVTDTRNGLTWKRCAEGFDFSGGVCTGAGTLADWETAKLIAQQSHYLERNDWRLPTIEEFEAVVGAYADCKDNRQGEYAASKAIAHYDGPFWSASPALGNTDLVVVADFRSGHVSLDGVLPYSKNYARLVRVGQVLDSAASLEFVNEIEEKIRAKKARDELESKVLADRAESERKVLAHKAESERIDENRRRPAAQKSLSAMPQAEFCAGYGNALREGEVDIIGSRTDIVKLVKKESARRKLKLDDSLVRKRHIKLGISECQLFASWGMPEDQNRSVGGWGVHIQHIYGSGTYVYTENGRVTSWQD